MADALHLLFYKNFEGDTLFKTQLELVQNLLNHPNSKYYIANKEGEEYLKAQSRLKTYISQLLSSTVNRTVTEDFSTSLYMLIEKRLKGTNLDPKHVLADILEDLKTRNSSSAKYEPKQSIIDQIYSDLGAANYIAVVTSRPLDLTMDLDSKTFSFQRFLMNELTESFTEAGKKIKSYRFNFPLPSFCELFWKGLKKFIRYYIARNIHEESLYRALHINYKLADQIIKPLRSKKFSNDDLEKIADCLLEYLNANRFILVFQVTAPIYTIPVIAIDPDDPKAARLYAILENGNENIYIHRYQKEDYQLWRLFVWDNLKTNIESRSIKYLKKPFE